MQRTTKRRIDGIFLLNKPTGISSNAALQRVKRLFNAKKAGHTGSLDVLASGMLPICLGEATKFSQFLLTADKHYEVRAKLGVVTTTGDAEGDIVATNPVQVAILQLQDVLTRYRGTIEQIPSMFSALKQKGRPLYELARQGIEVPRAPRPVTIYALDLQDYAQDEFALHVHCSKGTYVRTLVEDIGKDLGCGAHVIALHRTQVGPYQAEQMMSLPEAEQLCEATGNQALEPYLLPITSAVTHWPDVRLSSATAYYLQQGQAVMIPHAPTQGWVRLLRDEQFLGMGEVLDDGKIAPRRLVCRG